MGANYLLQPQHLQPFGNNNLKPAPTINKIDNQPSRLINKTGCGQQEMNLQLIIKPTCSVLWCKESSLLVDHPSM
jgi:hypothetical protein